MCRKLLLLVLVLGFVGSVQAALVHEWDFDSNVTDGSGSGNHGTLTGTATYVDPVDAWNGGTGKALSLNGATKVEDLAGNNLPIAGTGSYSTRAATFSINVFVKQNAAASILEIIGGIGDYGTTADNCYLGTYYSENWLRFGSRIDAGSASPYNEWAMLTAVCPLEGNPVYSDMLLYKNGVYLESTAVATGDFANRVGVGWGNNNPEGDSSPYWSGLIDGFQVYNHALTQGDIDTLYERIPEPATIALLGLGGLVLLRRKR